MKTAIDPLSQLAAALSAELTLAGVEHVLTGSLVPILSGRPPRRADIDLGVVVPSIRELRTVFDVAGRHGFTPEDRLPVSRVASKYHVAMIRGDVVLDVIVPLRPYPAVIAKRATRFDVAGVAVPMVTTDELTTATAG